MSEAEVPARRRPNVVPMLRRFGEAIRMVFGLVDSIARLEKESAALTLKVDELRREVDQQAGQVKVLLEFVRSALDDRVEKRAEAAAREILANHQSKTGGNKPKEKK